MLEYANSISVFISWILWDIIRYLLSKLLQDIQESLSCLDKISGLLLYSLGTFMTNIITAHLWEGYLCIDTEVLSVFLVFSTCFLFMKCMDALYWYYHCFCWPMGYCIAGWRCKRFFWFNWIPRNCFFRLKKAHCFVCRSKNNPKEHWHFAPLIIVTDKYNSLTFNLYIIFQYLKMIFFI